MYALTKIIGVVLFAFGLVLFMACFDSVHQPLEESILLSVGGLVFIAVGALCLIWHEPYNDEDQY